MGLAQDAGRKSVAKVEALLIVIVMLPVIISSQLSAMSRRLKQHFPIEKEQNSP